MTYFVIYGTEDGTRINTYQESSNLLKDISPETSRVIFLTSFEDRDPQDWPEHAVLIIKGEIVVPRPVKVVTEYEL